MGPNRLSQFAPSSNGHSVNGHSHYEEEAPADDFADDADASPQARPSQARPSRIIPAFRSAGELIDEFPELRPPVIDGLLRQGETMNVIAAPKTGKSWLTLDLALSVATGRTWLSRFPVAPGNVLIIDNELHGETIANRIPKVAEARGISREDYEDRLFVDNLRGRLLNIHDMADYFDLIEPGRFALIVLDAFYRFLPKDVGENDNAGMAQVYNQIDKFAEQSGASFVLIHHSTKGDQSGKAVTDVGAGAGAQSRAADAHVILRPHEESGSYVLEAVNRSFAPVESMALRRSFPVFEPAGDLNPEDLKRPVSRGDAKQASRDREGVEAVRKALQENGPLAEGGLRKKAGMGQERLNRILRIMRDAGEVACEDGVVNGNATVIYRLPE